MPTAKVLLIEHLPYFDQRRLHFPAIGRLARPALLLLPPLRCRMRQLADHIFRFSRVRFRTSFNNRVLLFLSAFRYSSLTRSRYCSRECMSILGAFTALHRTRALGHILK